MTATRIGAFYPHDALVGMDEATREPDQAELDEVAVPSVWGRGAVGAVTTERDLEPQIIQ